MWGDQGKGSVEVKGGGNWGKEVLRYGNYHRWKCEGEKSTKVGAIIRGKKLNLSSGG